MRTTPLKPPVADAARRNRGTDDKIGKGIDVALVALTFLGLGYVLDRWLGTKPLFMVALVVLALIGEFLRFWYDYDARMKVLEAQRAAARSSSSPSSSSPSSSSPSSSSPDRKSTRLNSSHIQKSRMPSSA